MIEKEAVYSAHVKESTANPFPGSNTSSPKKKKDLPVARQNEVVVPGNSANDERRASKAIWTFLCQSAASLFGLLDRC
jgi:hypothetical protein